MSTYSAGQIHSREEWDAIKDVFIRLYITEAKPLYQVRKILYREYGFVANNRQYKRRIEEWGAQKTKQDGSSAGAAASTDGRSRRHTGRSGANSATNVVLRSAATRPKGSIQSSGHLRSLELLREAVFGFFPSEIRAQNATIVFMSTTWDLGQFYTAARTICAYMASADFNQVKSLYSQVQELVDRIVHDRNPIIITCMMQVCCYYFHQNQLPVLRILLTYISARAAESASNHPLKHLCNALLDSLDFLPNLLLSGSDLAVKTSTEVLTADDPQTLSAQRGLYSALIAAGDYGGALNVAQPLMDREAQQNRESESELWKVDALMRVISCELSIMRLDSAEAHILELEELLPVVPEKAQIPLRRYCVDYKGELKRLQGDPEGIEYIQEALVLAQQSQNPARLLPLLLTQKHLAHALSPEQQIRPTPFIYHP